MGVNSGVVMEVAGLRSGSVQDIVEEVARLSNGILQVSSGVLCREAVKLEKV